MPVICRKQLLRNIGLGTVVKSDWLLAEGYGAPLIVLIYSSVILLLILGSTVVRRAISDVCLIFAEKVILVYILTVFFLFPRRRSIVSVGDVRIAAIAICGEMQNSIWGQIVI